MPPILGIPRLRCAFYRLLKSTESGKQIHRYLVRNYAWERNSHTLIVTEQNRHISQHHCVPVQSTIICSQQISFVSAELLNSNLRYVSPLLPHLFPVFLAFFLSCLLHCLHTCYLSRLPKVSLLSCLFAFWLVLLTPLHRHCHSWGGMFCKAH